MQAKSIRDLQADARYSLLGHLGISVGIILFYLAVFMFLSSLNTSGLTENILLSTLLTILLNYLVSVMTGIVEFGVSYVFLHLQLEQPIRIQEIFLPVRENADKAVRIKGYLCFLYLLASLPSLIMSAVMNGREGVSYWLPVGAALAVGYLARLFVTMVYGVIDYLFVDFPDSDAAHLLRASRRMMQGHRLRFLLLHLSFLPLHLLGLLSLGLANAWVSAYENAAVAAFYIDLLRLRTRPDEG
jgi:uncharacterized membrane protein